MGDTKRGQQKRLHSFYPTTMKSLAAAKRRHQREMKERKDKIKRKVERRCESNGGCYVWGSGEVQSKKESAKCDPSIVFLSLSDGIFAQCPHPC